MRKYLFTLLGLTLILGSSLTGCGVEPTKSPTQPGAELNEGLRNERSTQEPAPAPVACGTEMSADSGSLSTVQTAVGILGGSALWPNGVVHYDSASLRAMGGVAEGAIRRVMGEWSTGTGVRFVDKNLSASAPDYVYFRTVTGSIASSETIGRKGGAQYVALTSPATTSDYERVVRHELGHMLGLHHEFIRPDRDTWLTVRADHIAPGEDFTTKLDGRSVRTWPWSFDRASVMNYDSCTASKDGWHICAIRCFNEPTDETECAKHYTLRLSAGSKLSEQLIRRSHILQISDGDRKAVAELYPVKGDPCPDYNAGLCYPRCRPGFSGSGPVCWEQCPAGYVDDGAFCRRPGSIIGADNSGCPWYDKCGLTFSKGCSKCPPDYSNDGCTCRRDPHIFAKSSYTRGPGWVP